MSTDPLNPYREAVRAHGAGFEATLWGSPRTQVLRFEVMVQMLGVDALQGTHILDLGCGDGALAQWLSDSGVSASVHGLDAMQEMTEAGQARGVEGATFDVVDLTGDWPEVGCDWCIVSGTLNTMDDTTVSEVLARAWGASKQGLVFNFLGDAPAAHWNDKPLGPSKRRSVSAMLAWAGELAPRVDVRDDYLEGHDVTIAMWRTTA